MDCCLIVCGCVYSVIRPPLHVTILNEASETSDIGSKKRESQRSHLALYRDIYWHIVRDIMTELMGEPFFFYHRTKQNCDSSYMGLITFVTASELETWDYIFVVENSIYGQDM